MRGPLVFFLLIACSDQKVTSYNTPPAVSILSPVDGQAFGPGDLVEFYGLAQDSQDESTSLVVSWASNVDGQLGTDPPDSEGTVYMVTNALSGGEHIITLTGADTAGESANASIRISVEQGSSSVGAPTVVLVGPSEGSTFLEGEAVTFIGAVTDPDQTWDTLSAKLLSTTDGVFWEGNPDSGGTVSVPWDALSVGEQTVTLQAEDADGNVSSDSVTFTIGEDGRPTAIITSPPAGTVYGTDDTVVLEGQVSDDESDTEDLLVTWTSSLDGELASGPPDSSGYAVAPAHLSEGTHVIKLTVYDTDAKEGTDTITISVLDPDNVDDDGDGYTENEGDCDDGDYRTHPGASDTCDDADNDCDGYVNEDYWDDYEPNDSTSAPYDLGEIDSSFLWDGDSASVSGLTLHSADDTDCFKWDADDEIYDNVAINISIGVFAASGTYSATLYMEDGTWRTKDSASGTARLTLSYDGDYFDTDEDNWMVCVTATSWDDAVCDGTAPYTIDIGS